MMLIQTALAMVTVIVVVVVGIITIIHYGTSSLGQCLNEILYNNPVEVASVTTAAT